MSEQTKEKFITPDIYKNFHSVELNKPLIELFPNGLYIQFKVEPFEIVQISTEGTFPRVPRVEYLENLIATLPRHAHCAFCHKTHVVRILPGGVEFLECPDCPTDMIFWNNF